MGIPLKSNVTDSSDPNGHTILKEGSFYAITDEHDAYVLHDRTKRGLEVRERSVDEKTGVMADKGMIYGMDGIGHLVAIRWRYDKSAHDISDVKDHADIIERRYEEIRNVTCPDD